MCPTKIDSISKIKYNLRNEKKRRLRRNRDDPESESESESEYETVSESEESMDDEEEEEETTDSSYRPPKKKNKRRIVLSESESEESEEEEKEKKSEMTGTMIRQYLSQLFPSRYMNEKVKKDEKSKKNKKPTKKGKKHVEETESSDEEMESSAEESFDDEETESTEEEEEEKKKSKKSNKSPAKKSSAKYSPKKKLYKKSSKHKKRQRDDESSSSDSFDEYACGGEEEYYDSDDEEDEDSYDEKGKKLNIIFRIRGNSDNDYAQDYEDYFKECDEDEAALDDENDECDSDDEKTFMKENYQEVIVPDESTKDAENKKKTKKEKQKEKKLKEKKTKKQKEEEEKKPELADIETEYLEIMELKKSLTEKLHKKPNNKILRNAVKECNESIMKLIKTARLKNTKSYHKLINVEKNKTNEIDYFKKKLSNKEQLKIMKDLQEINEHIFVEKPYRLSLLQSKMPAKLKAIAMQKLNILRSMEPIDNEYHKIKNWIDTFMKIPFGIHKSLSVNMSDGIDVCDAFLKNAKNTLDECVFGLDDAKIQIMQMLGQWIANPAAMGTAIAIKGPMGTGKTTLVKEGISKILGREFAFIALGGAGDSSFLEGHSYTYEGSTWGKIVQILIDSKCMNPVIYFDELDKISDTARGQEIIGILTHLTDTSQNSQFHDKYFSEIDFDLSKCLFIFSYNDESLVNPILRDRMYRIQTKGYDCKEKTVIARNYLLPKICEQVNFKEDDVVIPDDTIQHIVTTESFTKKEDGVRNLKRCLEIIHTKLNLHRLVKPGTNIFGKEMDMQVSFPFTVTRKIIDGMIKNEENQQQSILNSMYI